MGKTGPKPQGKIEVLTQTDLKRPESFPEISEDAKVIWNRIVNAYAPDYFRPQHFDLLRGYCETAVMHSKAVAMVEKEGAIIVQKNGASKRNPWAQERDACANVMAQLATKLNIAKNAAAVKRDKSAAGQAQDNRRAGLLYRG